MTIDLRVELFFPFTGQALARKSECVANSSAKQASNDATVLLILTNRF
jgi:hypothetical protein